MRRVYLLAANSFNLPFTSEYDELGFPSFMRDGCAQKGVLVASSASSLEKAGFPS